MTEPRSPSIDELIDRVMSAMPADIRQVKSDFEQHLREALKSVFNRMDLVTREEFDVQAALLARTRERLEELIGRLDELESQQSGRRTPDTGDSRNGE